MESRLCISKCHNGYIQYHVQIKMVAMYYWRLYYLGYLDVIMELLPGSELVLSWFNKDIQTSVASLAFVYSMYLMMDHNKDHYFKFLRTVYRMRLHWLCCKYGYVVYDQISQLEQQMEIIVKDTGQQKQDISFQTTNISINDHAIGIKQTELSVETCTVII